MNKPFFFFYEEPDPDRWLPWDHIPRRWIRTIARGPAKPGGVMRWFLNLKTGLDELGVEYRLNDFKGLRNSPGAWAHVVGKSHVVDKIPAGHPIIFGPGIAAHPYDDSFWDRADIRLILISCEWFRAMYDRDLPRKIPTALWPAGVETDLWKPPAQRPSPKEILLYDKVRWKRDQFEPDLIQPIIRALQDKGCTVHHLRYGSYDEDKFRELLTKVGAMVFLCEHETQGFAYLQTLTTGVPILAWNRGGFWQDPSLYPHRVRFEPVSSIPYFDSRCGQQFQHLEEFKAVLPGFLEKVAAGNFSPRDYVVENLRLAPQARKYLELCAAASSASR
jgi:hypothetical protein